MRCFGIGSCSEAERTRQYRCCCRSIASVPEIPQRNVGPAWLPPSRWLPSFALGAVGTSQLMQNNDQISCQESTASGGSGARHWRSPAPARRDPADELDLGRLSAMSTGVSFFRRCGQGSGAPHGPGGSGRQRLHVVADAGRRASPATLVDSCLPRIRPGGHQPGDRVGRAGHAGGHAGAKAGRLTRPTGPMGSRIASPGLRRPPPG